MANRKIYNTQQDILSSVPKLWAMQINADPQPTATVVIKANPTYVSTVTERLAPYKNFPNTQRQALVNVASYVKSRMIPLIFKKEGPGWRPLAPRTVSDRIRLGFPGKHPILYRTGDLLAELTQSSHPRHVEIIKTGKYARVEIGGSSEKFIRNQMGDGSYRIPPRPMLPGTGGLPVSKDDKIEIQRIIKQSIQSTRTNG